MNDSDDESSKAKQIERMDAVGIEKSVGRDREDKECRILLHHNISGGDGSDVVGDIK